MGLRNYFRAGLFFLVTLLIYLGVTLLSWGLADLGGYFSNAARLGYAAAVTLFSLAIGLQAFSSTQGIRGQNGKAGKLVVRQTVVRIIWMLLLYLALFLIPYFDRHALGVINPGNSFRWLGVLLAALGYALIFWSGVALGRQYSPEVTIQAGHRLITTSIYRYLRHPRYLGILALSVGLSCVFRSWLGLLVSVFVLLILLFRIKDEEDLMHAEFGAEWEAYRKHSWRLFPSIY